MVQAAVPMYGVCFTGLTDEELGAIASIALERRCLRNNVLFYEAEPSRGIYLVLTGRVKLVRADAGGRQQILGIWEGGHTLAIVSANDPYPYTAITLSDSTVWFVPSGSFEELVRRHPNIALKLLEEQARQLQQAYGLACDLAFKSVPQRIASLLLSLADEQGKMTGEGIVLDDCVSRKEMAERLGTCHETVIRVLSQMGRAKIIKLRRHQILIADRAKLTKWSGV